MSFLARLFGTSPDPKDALRPLWHRTVDLAREPAWYTIHGAQDTVDGRFDVITSVLSIVLLRMESSDALRVPSVLLTELFVEDMDGQLRQNGFGDPTLGKRVGQMVSVLGGRLGAYRKALMTDGEETMETVVARNVSLDDESNAASFAQHLQALHSRLADIEDDAILEGNV